MQLMIKQLFLWVILFSGLLFYQPKSIANEVEQPSTTIEARAYELNAEIVAVAELSANSPKKTHHLLEQLLGNGFTFNYAEQYLILLTKARVKQHQNQHQDVVELLEQAKLLRNYIDKKQLNTPLFSTAYLVLATSYVAMKDFENAYHAKKAFVDEYNDYRDSTREDTVKVLTKKYEIAHKIEANKLLDNQNKLKELRIDEVNRLQAEQQRQFILITCTILVFVLLFLRQLKIRKKLLLLAKTDTLTGLLNRSSLFQEGQNLIQTSRDKQNELSILLFDVDHFKLINEQFGHQCGDLVLIKIAELVNETMRSRDIFARLGGEEFVALLPNTDIDKAKAIAVRVMEKIEQYDFNALGVNEKITLSIGVANSKGAGMVFDVLLHAADLAMYQAKAQGRNQMVCYESIVEDQERRQR